MATLHAKDARCSTPPRCSRDRISARHHRAEIRGHRARGTRRVVLRDCLRRTRRQHDPPAYAVLDDQPIHVATRIRGIVVGAVVVYGPIRKLEVTVVAYSVDVEEVHDPDFAGP